MLGVYSYAASNNYKKVMQGHFQHLKIKKRIGNQIC